MHGLIFVTWERYIAERFGSAQLHAYRNEIGETAVKTPLANRIYSDEMLLIGVKTLCRLSNIPTDTLLREYGRYFIINGLTSHLCAYLLTQVHSGKDLLLMMRSAHAQLRRTPDRLTPPLFRYEHFSADPNTLLLIYDSPRKLCPVLFGAIEGAAERYGEQVSIVERTCMRRGAPSCRIAITFHPARGVQQSRYETREQIHRQKEKQYFANMVLAQLPHQEGITLGEIYLKLQGFGYNAEQLRLRTIFEALRHLQFAGLIASSANRSSDDIVHRRYWKTPTGDEAALPARQK